MDESTLRIFAERARSLAVLADPFTKARLIELAQRYDDRIDGRAVRHVVKLANLLETPSRRVLSQLGDHTTLR